MSVRSPSGASARRDRVDALAHRQALAGQRRLGDLERRRREHAPVGGHDVAGLDLHDVAGHELLGGQQAERAVAAHPRLDDHHLRQRRHRRRGLALLAEPEHRVEQREQQDHDPRAGLLDRVDRDHARRQQHDLHRVRYWRRNACQRGSVFGLGELVRPVACEPRGRLLARQALRRARRRARAVAPSVESTCQMGVRLASSSGAARWSPSRVLLSAGAARRSAAAIARAGLAAQQRLRVGRSTRSPRSRRSARRTSTRRGPSAPSSRRRTRCAPSSSGVALRIARCSGVPQSA